MPKNLKIILAAVLLGIVVLFVAFVIVALYDAPAPDDSAYKTTYNPVPPETNAITTLKKLVGKVKANLSDYPELDGAVSGSDWYDFLQGDKIDFELQALVVMKNQEALALLSEAMRKPDAQFAPFSPTDVPPMPTAPMTTSSTQTFTDSKGVTHEVTVTGMNPRAFGPTLTSEFFGINKIARATWQNTKDGKVIFAWDDALANFQFAKKYGAAENASLVDFIVALACETNDADLMIKNIGNLEDKKIAIETAAILGDGSLAPADFKSTLKAEYRVFDYGVSIMEKAPKKNILFSRYVFKPNSTRQQEIDRLTTMCEAIDRGDYSLGIPPRPDFFKMNFVEKGAYMLRPNLGGRALLDMTIANVEKIHQSALDNLARLRVQSCAFALRAYWLDHGRLPDSLGNLVPEYIKAVPLDIFGGKPLQYDRERGVVYSAGPKLVYGTGEFAREPKAGPLGERPFVLLDWDEKK